MGYALVSTGGVGQCLGAPADAPFFWLNLEKGGVVSAPRPYLFCRPPIPGATLPRCSDTCLAFAVPMSGAPDEAM
jgi:hypothetical protein